jgi:hypothetical protein
LKFCAQCLKAAAHGLRILKDELGLSDFGAAKILKFLCKWRQSGISTADVAVARFAARIEVDAT